MNRLEARIAKQAERLARQSERIDKGDKALFARLEELEVGLQEERRLHLRIAELSDLVTGLLAAATQGEEAFRHALESTDLAGGAADVTLAQQ